jgi:iron-sulfur cluster assembly accessory protein
MGEKPLDSITIEEKALDAAYELQQANPQWAGLPLRLYIEGKGCDGFYYGLSFDEAAAGDQVVLSDSRRSLSLIVDQDSLPYLQGTHITWHEDETGQRGFLVNNPQQRAFRGKFYKRSAWMEKFKQRGASEQAANDTPADPPHE